MNKEVSFKESRIVGTTILLLGTGFLMSWVSDGNYMLLIVECLFYKYCIKTKHESICYFSLKLFVIINVIAIDFSITLLCIYLITPYFWIGVFILIIMVKLPYVYARKIEYGVQKPSKSKI